MVEGRLDNLFISGGENIQPETIEQRLVDHPAVAQALVVPVPSDEWGHRPAAFIDWHGEPVPLPSWPPGSGCRYPASWCRTSGIPGRISAAI